VNSRPFQGAFAFCGLILLSGSLRGVPKVEVNVVVDMTPEGRKVAPPTPGHPVYYLPALAGYKELGALIAGEPPPPPQAEVAHLLAVTLARQGYMVMKPVPHANAAGEVTYSDGTVVRVQNHARRGLPAVMTVATSGGKPLTLAMLHPENASSAGTGSPSKISPFAAILTSVDPVHGPIISGMPSIILVMHYGSANPEIESMPGMGEVFFNQAQMLGLLGGNTLDHLDLDFEREPVMQGAREDRYYVAVTAYDFAPYVQTRKKVMLWQAKMSVPANRVYFADVVTTLVETGGPFFGHETYRPKQFIEPAVPEGHVEVGVPTVKP